MATHKATPRSTVGRRGVHLGGRGELRAARFDDVHDRRRLTRGRRGVAREQSADRFVGDARGFEVASVGGFCRLLREHRDHHRARVRRDCRGGLDRRSESVRVVRKYAI